MNIVSCKGCGEQIVFLKTAKGKIMPVDAETWHEGEELFDSDAGHVSHFETCPDAKAFRKARDNGS